MASVYMRIDGIDNFKGMATVKEIAGKKGFFPLASFQVGYGRSVVVNVGSSGDAEVGTPSISDVVVDREPDAASAILETLFFAPGDKGKTFEIIQTKTKNDGKGLIPTRIVTLEEARISSYATSSGGNSIAIAFTTIAIAHYYEETSGKIEKGDVVKFDLRTGELVSGNQDAMK